VKTTTFFRTAMARGQKVPLLQAELQASAAATLRARREWARDRCGRSRGSGARFIGRRGGAEAAPRAVELGGGAAGH
jgi:hypothetical protein